MAKVGIVRAAHMATHLAKRTRRKTNPAKHDRKTDKNRMPHTPQCIFSSKRTFGLNSHSFSSKIWCPLRARSARAISSRGAAPFLGSVVRRPFWSGHPHHPPQILTGLALVGCRMGLSKCCLFIYNMAHIPI